MVTDVHRYVHVTEWFYRALFYIMYISTSGHRYVQITEWLYRALNILCTSRHQGDQWLQLTAHKSHNDIVFAYNSRTWAQARRAQCHRNLQADSKYKVAQQQVQQCTIRTAAEYMIMVNTRNDQPTAKRAKTSRRQGKTARSQKLMKKHGSR